MRYLVLLAALACHIAAEEGLCSSKSCLVKSVAGEILCDRTKFDCFSCLSLSQGSVVCEDTGFFGNCPKKTTKCPKIPRTSSGSGSGSGSTTPVPTTTAPSTTSTIAPTPKPISTTTQPIISDSSQAASTGNPSTNYGLYIGIGAGVLVFVIGAAYIYSKKFKTDEYYEDDEDDDGALKTAQRQPPNENESYNQQYAAPRLRDNDEEAAILATSSYRSTHQPLPRGDDQALHSYRGDLHSVSSFNEIGSERSEVFEEEEYSSRRNDNYSTASVEF
jgi:hypothetical protein